MAVLLLLGVVLWAQTLDRAARPEGNDLTGYLAASRAWLASGDPYLGDSPFPYRYPPFLAVALVPLALLPLELAASIWYAVGVAALALTVRRAVRLGADLTGVNWDDRLLVPLALGALALLTPLQSNFVNGQVNFAVLALTLAAVVATLEDRPLAAALPLAVAIAIKLTPAVFLIFLAQRRRVGALVLTVAIAAALGWAPAAWAEGGVLSVLEGYGRSLSELLARPPTFPRGFPPFSLAGVAVWLWPALAGDAGVRLFAAAAVLGLLVLADSSPRGGAWVAQGAWAWLLSWLAMLLASPISEKHHLAFACPAAVLAGLAAWRGRLQHSPVGIVLVVLAWTGLALGHRVTSFPVHLVALLLLAGALGFLRPRKNEPNLP